MAPLINMYKFKSCVLATVYLINAKKYSPFLFSSEGEKGSKYISTTSTVNLEILAAKIFSISRSIDILANINFSNLVLDYFSSNFIM